MTENIIINDSNKILLGIENNTVNVKKKNKSVETTIINT